MANIDQVIFIVLQYLKMIINYHIVLFCFQMDRIRHKTTKRGFWNPTDKRNAIFAIFNKMRIKEALSKFMILYKTLNGRSKSIQFTSYRLRKNTVFTVKEEEEIIE